MYRQTIRQSGRRSLVVAVDPIRLLDGALFYVAPLNPLVVIYQPALPCLSSGSIYRIGQSYRKVGKLLLLLLLLLLLRGFR